MVPVLNDSFAGQDVLVFMDRGTETALAYDRRVDGRSLTFSLSPETSGARSVLIDNDETGSLWMAITGQAFEGPLKGKRLERVPSHLSFWFAWKDWNPHTELSTKPWPSSPARAGGQARGPRVPGYSRVLAATTNSASKTIAAMAHQDRCGTGLRRRRRFRSLL